MCCLDADWLLLSGQVGGVAVSSAIFQTVLDRELKLRITTPDAPKVCFSLSLTEMSTNGISRLSARSDIRQHLSKAYHPTSRGILVTRTQLACALYL
jgi:hypothetical protein